MVKATTIVLLLAAFVASVESPRAIGQTSAALTVTTATDGILNAFQNNPLVGLSDDHAFAQEEDFYVSLIRDPRFAKQVGNVVVEFGNASQQQTLDRYVDGGDVPYEELRKVWADTSYVGWFPTVTALGYLNFYAAVRAANVKLPVEDRIHVWLGGKPVDWSKIKTKDDLSRVIAGQADRYPADLIEEQILKKGHSALVIYGTFHFYDKGSLAELIRQRHPGAMFVITPYTGFENGSCSDAFERTLVKGPLPALVAVRGEELDQRMHGSGCHFLDASNFAEMTEGQKAQVRSGMESQTSVLAGNSLLFLGPAKTLTKSPLSPDLYLDPEFRKENDRRAALFGGKPDPWPTVRDNPMSPKYLRDYGGHPNTPAN
jgi:hypothetical protein